MNLEKIHVLEKHIRPDTNPIEISAYMGNCDPCIPGKRKGKYQPGGYQWKVKYNCKTRNWKIERMEGIFIVQGYLNKYLDKWHHEKKAHPTTVKFDKETMTARTI